MVLEKCSGCILPELGEGEQWAILPKFVENLKRFCVVLGKTAFGNEQSKAQRCLPNNLPGVAKHLDSSAVRRHGAADPPDCQQRSSRLFMDVGGEYTRICRKCPLERLQRRFMPANCG